MNKKFFSFCSFLNEQKVFEWWLEAAAASKIEGFSHIHSSNFAKRHGI